MEVAKLILEFLKVLTWPVVALTAVLLFRPYLQRILGEFGDKLHSAETVKLGVMGQELQISGTAKELAKDRVLLAQTADTRESSEKLKLMDRAARDLNNPLADLVGLKLLESPEGTRLENLVHTVVRSLSPNETVQPQSPMAILAITREVEKILAQLQSLRFLKIKDGVCSLTDTGRRFFERVSHQQGEFLARYNALG